MEQVKNHLTAIVALLLLGVSTLALVHDMLSPAAGLREVTAALLLVGVGIFGVIGQADTVCGYILWCWERRKPVLGYGLLLVALATVCSAFLVPYLWRIGVLHAGAAMCSVMTMAIFTMGMILMFGGTSVLDEVEREG